MAEDITRDLGALITLEGSDSSDEKESTNPCRSNVGTQEMSGGVRSASRGKGKAKQKSGDASASTQTARGSSAMEEGGTEEVSTGETFL